MERETGFEANHACKDTQNHRKVKQAQALITARVSGLKA